MCYRYLSVVLAVISVFAAPVANAWTLIPGMGYAARVATHLVGGAIIQHVLAEECEATAAQGSGAVTCYNGVTIAAAIGVVKEATDSLFDPLEALAWPVGAWLWQHRHDKALYPGAQPGSQEDYALEFGAPAAIDRVVDCDDDGKPIDALPPIGVYTCIAKPVYRGTMPGTHDDYTLELGRAPTDGQAPQK